MTRFLARRGLVERRPGPGRTIGYRLREDAWTRLLEDDLRSAARLRGFAEEGLRLMGGRTMGRAVQSQRLTGQIVMWVGAWSRMPIVIALGARVVVQAWLAGLGRIGEHSRRPPSIRNSITSLPAGTRSDRSRRGSPAGAPPW